MTAWKDMTGTEKDVARMACALHCPDTRVEPCETCPLREQWLALMEEKDSGNG